MNEILNVGASILLAQAVSRAGLVVLTQTWFAGAIATVRNTLAIDAYIASFALTAGFTLLFVFNYAIATYCWACPTVIYASFAGLAKTRVADAVAAASTTVSSTSIAVFAIFSFTSAVAAAFSAVLRAGCAGFISTADVITTSGTAYLISVRNVTHEFHRFDVDPANFVRTKVIGFDPQLVLAVLHQIDHIALLGHTNQLAQNPRLDANARFCSDFTLDIFLWRGRVCGGLGGFGGFSGLNRGRWFAGHSHDGNSDICR